MSTPTRADREVAVACEFGNDWRSWMSDRRIFEIESYIEGHSRRFSRDHAAECIAAYRIASTASLEREIAERTEERDHAREEGYAHVDLLMLRERERDAALRELAELRGLLERVRDAWSGSHPQPPWMTRMDTTVRDVIARLALLPAASEPAKEPSDHGFAVGDMVDIPRRGKAHTDHGVVTAIMADGFERIRVRCESGPTVTFLPNELVLVRKAKEPSDG